MRHIKFKDQGPWPIALLIKSSAFVQHEIQSTYVYYLEKRGIPKEEVIAFTLDYNSAGKAPVSYIKEYLETLMVALSDCDVEYLYCADANYFKVLTGTRKAEPHLGYVLPCKIEGYEHMKVILGVNHRSLIYNPANEPKLLMSMDTLIDAVQGTHVELGSDIIKEAHYPQTFDQIQNWLNKLHEHPHLSCDIEAFSLDFDKAGIGTITFCWDEHHGVAFACDYAPHANNSQDENGFYGEYLPNPYVRMLLKEFFETYQGQLTFHRANYDVKVLIAHLWMKDWLDTAGLLTGLDILCERMHDTRIIAYLALNSTAGNDLSLKTLAHEFAGNWAQDEIKDIRKIPLPDLLQYNLVDGLSTHYVFKKYYPKMVADQQEELYYSLMMPSQKVIIQMELTGMPLDPQKVKEVRTQLEGIIDEQLKVFQASNLVSQAEELLTRRAWEKDYEDRKYKAKHPDKIKPKDWDTFPRVTYNPNSGPQTQTLLYEICGLPVIDYTDTRQPAVGGKTLKKLQNHTQDEQVLELLTAMIDFLAADKVLGTFITAFENALDKGTPVVWLHGNFNLGGTVSGRLSSSDPNLQNIPSGSRFAKLIKECFVSFPGWIFCGADFSALEDRINALLTKDPAKLKIYTDGFDGHCLRTFYYWPHEFQGMKETPEEINSIEDIRPDLRQKSKGPSFALQYGGTWLTMVKNAGFSEEDAKAIEANYHTLYVVSTEWVKAKIAEAARKGYAEGAFGLRIRTPLIHRSLMNNSATPREADAEARTLGNAISGQSYGLLNSRACNEFMKEVWASPYRYDIKPVAQIHDAIYLLIRDDVRVVEWVNRTLIKHMEWQELPEIQHPEVKLEAELDLYWPNWDTPLTLPNNATQEQIRAMVADHLQKFPKAA